MNRHEDPGQNMIQHIFGEKPELNTCLVFKIFHHDKLLEIFSIYYLHHIHSEDFFFRFFFNSSSFYK